MSKRNKYNLDELDLLTKFRQVKRSNINLFTEDSSSQESVSYEHINSLDEGVCCSEKVPLLHSGRNMKITGGNYTEIYGISRTENADEQVTEKQRKRLRKKKVPYGQTTDLLLNNLNISGIC